MLSLSVNGEKSDEPDTERQQESCRLLESFVKKK
jgi:hypothetical protein